MSATDLSRFATFRSYDAEDVESFEMLTGPRRSVSKGGYLRLEGSPEPEVFMLRSGWLACSIGTTNGNRQISKVQLPGDLVGMPSMASSEAVETIQALTDAVVDVIPLEVFGRIFRERPRFGALLFLWSQEERVHLMHRLVISGRSDGAQRIGSFLLALYRRLLISQPDLGNSFALPMTQQDLGDATGMSAVHANRSLRQLRWQRLVTWRDGNVTLHDVDGLATFAGGAPMVKRNTDWR